MYGMYRDMNTQRCKAQFRYLRFHIENKEWKSQFTCFSQKKSEKNVTTKLDWMGVWAFVVGLKTKKKTFFCGFPKTKNQAKPNGS